MVAELRYRSANGVPSHSGGSYLFSAEAMALRGTQMLAGDAAVRATSAGIVGAAVIGEAAIQTIRASGICNRRRGRSPVDVQGNEVTTAENTLHLCIQSQPGSANGTKRIERNKWREEKEEMQNTIQKQMAKIDEMEKMMDNYKFEFRSKEIHGHGGGEDCKCHRNGVP